MARQPSDYHCPHCRSRLTYSRSRGQDLFCGHCFAAVCLVDTEHFVLVLADQPFDLQVGQVSDLMPQL